MARKRVLDIHELVFDPELVRTLKSKGLILYEVLWGNADDFGGFELNYEKIKLWCGALPITKNEVQQLIATLINPLKKIVPYEADGRQYGWLKNLMKCQPLKNPSMPTLPLPEWIIYEIKQYPSGKKYAIYQVITEKVPVDYQYPTRTTETKPKETKRNQGKLPGAFLDYFNLKTGKKLAMTDIRRKIIEQRLTTHSLDQLKKAVDNFVSDDWPERRHYTDIVYCIGIRNKIDNLEKWLNFEPKPTKKKDPITVSVAMSMIARDQTTHMMEEILLRLPSNQLKEFEAIIAKKDRYMKEIYKRARKIVEKKKR